MVCDLLSRLIYLSNVDELNKKEETRMTVNTAEVVR